MAPTLLPQGYHPTVHEGIVDPKIRSLFQQVIGSLLYLMLRTCPDIACAVIALLKHAAKSLTCDTINQCRKFHCEICNTTLLSPHPIYTIHCCNMLCACKTSIQFSPLCPSALHAILAVYAQLNLHLIHATCKFLCLQDIPWIFPLQVPSPSWCNTSSCNTVT